MFELMQGLSENLVNSIKHQLTETILLVEDDDFCDIVLDSFIVESGGIVNAEKIVNECLEFYVEMDKKTLSDKDSELYSFFVTMKSMYEKVSQLINKRKEAKGD